RPRTRLSEEATELGIKEVFRLPKEKIDDRFGVSGLDGHAEEWVPGFFPKGVMGGGFLYTNRDTISVGIVVSVASLFGRTAMSHDVMEQFKLHPAIAPRLEGGELVEYGAKLIPAGWASRPAAFHGDGWMVAGDAAGFVFANGVVIQGMNYAVRSGIEAAEAALEARQQGRTTASRLSGYDARLEASGILSDFREFAGLDRVKWNPRIYSAYPELATEMFRRLVVDSNRPKQHFRRTLFEVLRKSGVPPWALALDGISLFWDF
ncbi:MAG TPA: hypothetical protein VLY85_00420, partial [Thermoplasmata archaeon]|nr:hypothetical protein [Thermoplasmata archaeon]